jgi:hypothetical protein
MGGLPHLRSRRAFNSGVSSWVQPAPPYRVADVHWRVPKLQSVEVVLQRVSDNQGLTLVHFSAQRKPILCDTLGACLSPSLLDRGTREDVTKTAQVELRSGRVLRDSGPCVVKKWRIGRPVPSVDTTFTRSNPVGDVTKLRVDTSVLSLRRTKQAIWTAVWFTGA